MKLRLVEVQSESGDRVLHALDQDSMSEGVLCGAVQGFDWRIDRQIGNVHDPTDIACPGCRRRAEELLDPKRKPRPEEWDD